MYLRVVWNGTIGTAEEFSVGASYVIDSPWVDWSQEDAEEVVDALLAIPVPATLLACFGANTRVTGIRFEGHEDNGKISGAAMGTYAEPQGGTAIRATHPPQTALVLSMKSSTPGQSGRGRLYWPAMGCELDSDFRLYNPSPLAIAEAFATYLQTVSEAIQNNAGVFPWTAVRLAVASPSKGTQAPVSRLEVGDVLDTQRRRRSGLVEVRYISTYPPTS